MAFLGFSALAVDLGWLYVQATRLQNAADSAALAGVVYLPSYPSTAQDIAEDATSANGYTVVGAGPVEGEATVQTAVLEDAVLEATLRSRVRTWFLPVLGIDGFDVARSSRAEYIKPVRLGSPGNQFGGGSQQFWAAINGQYTERQQGDPFATRCIEFNSGAPSPTCASSNPWYRDGGYYYGVEIAPGTSQFTVSFYDPGHFLTGGGGTRSHPHPGDTSWVPAWGGVELEARLFMPDTTPYNPTDNNSLVAGCSATAGSFLGGTPSGGFNGYQNWVNLCTVSGSAVVPGIYVLQLPAPLYEGSSKFAIRATSPGGQPAPRLYGLLDMSIHINDAGGSPQPWLAEVGPEHSGPGKTLEIDIFDIGESNTMRLEILGPLGSSVACSWTSSNGLSGSHSAAAGCVEEVGNRRFDSHWMYIRVPLESYTCDREAAGGTGCWWRVSITNMSNPTDRTTWAVRVSGNPIRLLP